MANLNDPAQPGTIKKAIELQPGDRVLAFDDRPNFNVYRGTVRNTVVVDRGLQINYDPSGTIVVPEDVLVKVAI